MRNYKRKRPRRWRDTDKRMVAAARLRGKGLSLRETAERLAVSHETVRRDLAKWDREHANVTALPRQPVTSDCLISPPGGQLVTPECDSEPGNIVEMRRRS